MATRQVDEVLAALAEMGRAENRAGMARFGIDTGTAYGISVADLRGLARRIGHDQVLARDLWQSGRHEARILAVLVAEPEQTDEALIDRWVADLNSWDLCDQFCNGLVRTLPFARTKALQWAAAEATFVRRAGFTLMATLAVHDKALDRATFEAYFRAIEQAARDDRNFVKKAVNWALRQIGKRSVALNAEAVRLAERLKASDSAPARWIGRDAVRELTSEKVRRRLKG